MLELQTMLRRRELLPVLVVLARDHLLDSSNHAKQITSRAHKVVFEDFVHSFHRGACDCVVVSVLRCPGSRPLMSRIPLIICKVFTKLLLVGIVAE